MAKMTAEETAALISRILLDFEDGLLFDKETTRKFIKYLVLVEIEEEEIYSFFEKYSQKGYLYRDYDEYECFKNYTRIFFWKVSSKIDHEHRDDYLSELEKYIIKITEQIILREEESLLVEDIAEFIKEKVHGLNISKRSYDNYEDREKAREVVVHFDPRWFLKENGTNKFYSKDLYEEIKKVIPLIFQDNFEYKCFKYSNPREDSEKSDTENKKTEPELSENILSKEMSDNEIIEKLKEYGWILLDKAAEDEIFLHRDGLIEPILQVPLNEIILHEGKCLENISKKVHRLISIGTKKSFLKIWEILGTRKCDYDIDLYIKIINKWTEHFPIKLLKREIENKNNVCIWGILHSKNEHIIIALFAMLYKNYYAIIIPNDSIDPFCNDEYIRSKYANYNYYILLICLSVEPHNEYTCLHCGYRIKSWYSPLHKEYLLDIIGIIKNDGVFGQKIKETLRKLNIDLTYKLTFEQFNEIKKLQKLSREYEQTKPKKEVDKHSKEVNSIFKDDDDDEPPLQKNEYEIKINEILNTDKVPQVLLDEYYNKHYIIAVEFWLYEGKELNLQDYFIPYLDRAIFNEIINKTLEKPFFFPKFSDENEKIMAYYFYQGFTFQDFLNQQEEGGMMSLLWKKYWRKFMEETYKKFEQPKFEKPLLPIIPEYADYLLSRTNDMFSTAIENIPYNEYKTFLTESRKLQIKICLKNKTIQKEEFDDLTKLAESSATNYYAWSDEEIIGCPKKKIKGCLLPGTDLEKLNAILEPEFMVRIFEKSILWVMEHKDSELWLNAPWFGVQIFNKSYRDRPAIWAKHLMKILNEWNGSENMLRRICIALGHLREPLGSKVPIKLKEMAENPQNENIKEDLLIQLSLFNHENFKKMYHKGNEIKRIELCKRELIIGQNKEVKKKMQE